MGMLLCAFTIIDYVHLTHRHLLYNFSKDKSSMHPEGVCYITSHRLIYVDTKVPRVNSVQLDLDTIKSIDTYVSIIQESEAQFMLYFLLVSYRLGS